MNRIIAIVLGILFGFSILLVDRIVPDGYVLWVFGAISNSETIDSILDLIDSSILKQKVEMWLMVLAAKLIPLFILSLIASLGVWWTGSVRLFVYSTAASVAVCLILASLALRQIKNIEPNLWLAMFKQVSDNSILYVVSVSLFLVMVSGFYYFAKKYRTSFT